MVTFSPNQTSVLPNGLEIYHFNRIETDFLYQEIFVKELYLHHGLELHEGDIIVDVGANIGLFSLFILSKLNDFKIYAFEPVPPTFELLQLNTKAHNNRITVFNQGLSDSEKKVGFTFYPSLSVFSGQFARNDMDSKLLKSILINKYQDSIKDEKLLHKFVDYFIQKNFTEEYYECSMTTLSKILAQHQISRIDFLKIDVEKSEFEVLAGIVGNDWAKIWQIAIEVHDVSQTKLQEVKTLLNSKGFDCSLLQEQEYLGLNTYNVYAKRNEV